MVQDHNNIIDIPNIDQRIYRVIDSEYLLDLFKRYMFVLTRPHLWDDPFENVLLKTRVVNPSGEVIDCRGIHDIFFGQCWSDNQKETDATWRIYSPNKTGVRISTTVSKLFKAVYNSWDRMNKYQSTDVFIGKVAYKSTSDIIQSIHDSVTKKVFTGSELAHRLLIKREEFQHEQEVRLLLVDPLHCIPCREKLCELNIDPKSLIDEIVFDPRMSDSKFLHFKIQLDALFQLEKQKPIIRKSELYSLPNIIINSVKD